MAPQTTSQQPSVVREIESRVEQLIADHKRIAMLNGELILQRNALLASKQQMQERIAKLEKDLAMAQLKAGLNGSGNAKNNRRARAYINRLMREVDTCITLLSSPEVATEGGNVEEGYVEEGCVERGNVEEGYVEEETTESVQD